MSENKIPNIQPTEAERLKLQTMTNVEFITYCMNHSKYGAMAQMVLMDALDKGTNYVLNREDELLALQRQNQLIDYRAWIATYRELRNRYLAKYNRN